MDRTYLIVTAFLGLSLSPSSMAKAEGSGVPPPLTAVQVAERMIQMDQWRVVALEDYTVTRRYVLDNKRFHKHAEMVVRMTYSYPGKKEFEVLSESGPGAVRKRVFHKLLEAELEGAQDGERNQTRITPANYEFQLFGTDVQEGRPCYVIEVSPKTESKLLFRGRIWVDAQDFAVARIEGSPAKNPSFWTRKIHFVHRYQKLGPFWLAASNQSVTEVRIFGSTEVTVEYLDYQINRGRPQNQNAPEITNGAATSQLRTAATPETTTR